MTASLTVLPVVLGLPALFLSFHCFDRLVQAQYEEARPEWEAEGRPPGFAWRPPECSGVLRGGWARNRACFVWLFAPPSWARTSEQGRRWLLRWRVSVASWNLLVGASAVLFLRHLGS